MVPLLGPTDTVRKTGLHTPCVAACTTEKNYVEVLFYLQFLDTRQTDCFTIVEGKMELPFGALLHWGYDSSSTIFGIIGARPPRKTLSASHYTLQSRIQGYKEV